MLSATGFAVTGKQTKIIAKPGIKSISIIVKQRESEKLTAVQECKDVDWQAQLPQRPATFGKTLAAETLEGDGADGSARLVSAWSKGIGG